MSKVLSGHASAEEQEQLKAWLVLHPEDKPQLEAMQMILSKQDDNDPYPPDHPFFDGLKKIKQAIRDKTERQIKIRFVFMVFLGIALCLSVAYLKRRPWDNMHNDVLRFDKAKVAQIITTLDDRYQVSVQAPSSILDCRFTGSFYQDSPTEAIQLLSGSLGLKYKIINDHTFTLEGTSCK